MKDIVAKIESHPVVPVYYHDDIAQCKSILKSCYNGGIRVFEFVNRGAFARQNFEALVAYRDADFPDLILGIGTIKTPQEALDFLALKADFIVSPIVNPNIAAVTLEKGICWVPGAMTPSEVALAESLGATLIKLFPGDLLGPSFVKAIKPLFPGLKFIATGGVLIDEQNISNWFAAGINAVGMGSKLFADINNDNDIEQRVKSLFSWVNEARK